MKERYFIIYNLEWDTDGKKIKKLPQETAVIVGEDTLADWEENDYDWDEIEYWIMDYLTDDVYGWCIAGCDIKEVSKEEFEEWERS